MSLATPKNTKLASWLRSSFRSSSPYKTFDVVDINEHRPLTIEVKSLLKTIIASALYDIDFLTIVAESLGWDTVQKMLTERRPKVKNLRYGDFGEIITNAILADFFGYIIPVQKLRYRIETDQSLPGTDSIALKVVSGAITDVSFVESKLRSGQDTSKAVEGYHQLAADYVEDFFGFTTFVLSRMHEEKHQLFSAFLAYLKDRKDTTNLESFRLGLVWEYGKWSETCLRNLEEARETAVPRMTVQLVRIQNLIPLIEELYGSLGITEITNDG
ncbi:MAG TPA: Hachiman antiphage defense system protein HamA [Candidatus Dormibacteraeota bacterium]|nr:Hachiman antiphage defense system protein HamA [Candidatus Dormibacteraeota bacterium]